MAVHCGVQKMFMRKLIFSIQFFTFVCSAHAITIDTFDGNQLSSSVGSGTTDYSVRSISSAIGGTRAMRTSVTSGALKTELETIVGLVSHSQSAGTVGNSLLTWDGDTTAANLTANGLGGIDFYQDGGTGVTLKVLEYNPGTGGANPTELTITVYDSSDPMGGKFSRALVSLDSTIAALTTIVVPFASFGNLGPNGAADFHHVGAVTLKINGKDPAVDLTLDWVGTNGKCELVPDTAGRVIDQCGVCGGDNSSCADCTGVPNGSHNPGTSCVTTKPGVCSSGKYTQSCLCASNVEPSSELCDGLDNDCDGLVDGMVYDECDVCGGDGSSCKDCAGVIKGTTQVDRCGVCGGDGQSCLDCQVVNQFDLQAQLDGLAKDQEKLIKNILKRLKKLSSNSSTNKYVQKVTAKAHALQIRNWTISWTLPTNVRQCSSSASTLCVKVSYTDLITEYRNHSEALRSLTNEVLRRLITKKGKFAAIDRRDDAKADSLFAQAMKLADKAQAEQTVCE